MKTGMKAVLLALGFATALAGATAASADTPWQKHHPRREEVNARLAHQSRRVTIERREGDLSGPKAHFVRAQDRAIRVQERMFASRHHGRLTKHEQRRLNREENRVSREIGR